MGFGGYLIIFIIILGIIVHFLNQPTETSNSDTSSNNNSGCLPLVLIILVFILLGSCASGGSSNPTRTGFDKWSSGNFDSMTDSERRAVNDFLEWSNDH